MNYPRLQPAPPIRHRMASATAYGRLTLPFLWVVALILSFAHERPILQITSMDRANPRLVDIMIVLGVLFVLPKLGGSRVRIPQQFFTWASIVMVFVFCSIIYATFLLPGEYAALSLFFAAKYIEGLIAIYIALKIPLTERHKRILQWAVAVGGLYVATYCIFEYNSGGSRNPIEIADGKFVRYYQQVLLGPLSYNYFHIAQFSSLTAIITLGLIETTPARLQRWFIFGLTAFVSWPLLFAGSRTGLGLLVISMPLGMLLLRGAGSRFITVAVAAGLAVVVFGLPAHFGFLEDSTTLQRITDSQGTDNSFESRITLFKEFNLDNYKWGTLMPLIGGGFYVVPALVGSSEVYRVGFGIHNTYLFPFEQAGAAAFVLFILFLVRLVKGLRQMAATPEGPDQSLAKALLAYVIASLPAYLTGQVFWMGFDTGNFNTFIVLMFMLGLVRSSPPSRVL